ncbi:MAG TPA: serine/threonine-protein kinase [Nocardioides sp.]|uniref:serine/threonine-protein kinase n=1 Tax=Nocardioides sp. TaxID=35761 RepID=UPI002EDB2449
MTTARGERSEGPRTIGDYTLLAPLGEGGMGVVHLARRPDGQRVALKVLRPHVVGDQETRERLAREVGSLSRIRNRWVAEIIDADPWAPVPYIATRYVPGLSLHDQVAQQGPVAGSDLAWLARCLLEGIAAVHEAGVLHRDVKPSNVLMEGRTPVLIDFGLARVADDAKLTRTGWLLGTPGYLAPEILYGDEPTPAVDVHAWAATVAYAATGRPPYGRGPAMAVMDRARRGEHDLSGAPADLRPVLDAALDPEPGRRPTVPQLLGWLRGHGPAPTTQVVPRVTRPPIEQPIETLPLAVLLDDADDGPTRVLDDPYADQREDPTGVAPPRAVGAPERLRRFVLWAAAALIAVAGLTAYPWLAGIALVVLVWLLRGGSLAASTTGERRRARGARWYDGPRLVLGAPWHVVRSAPGSLLLVLWSLGIVLTAGLLCYAVAASAGVTLAACGAVFVAGLSWGPGAGRVRSPLSRVVHPLASRPRVWLGAALVLLAVAGLLGGLAATQGAQWAPAGGPPFQGLLP